MSEETPKPQRPAPEIPSDMKAFNQKIIAEFRANKGQLSGQMAGRTLMLLTTTGAKSGQLRTAVLGFGREGENFIVVASNNAAPADPSWYRNLQAKPDATVEVGAEKIKVRARTARGADRERVKALLPYFAGQQEKTSRELPLVVLERVTA
jgi:deazaflavin-dependent oxidoreductase (nitroreductase family)